MNRNHLQEIFSHYIDKFEIINNSTHMEYYKWRIAAKFRPMMDEALKASDAELPRKLNEVKKMTVNIIDNYTSPFSGLSKFAEEEPQTVRGMFQSLFSDYGKDDIDVKQEMIEEFLRNSRSLRDKYYPDSYLYKDDMHSVTAYKFLYDPDHNFLYKASHSRNFADCIEFYDDWGSGDAVNLEVFSRMCNEVIEEIRNSPELMKTAASRFAADRNNMYPDLALHILVFDLIYCCSTYDLFDGIPYVVPKTSERKLMQEKKEKARMLSEELKNAEAELAGLEEAEKFLADSYIPGTVIHHKTYGEGCITGTEKNRMDVDFKTVGSKSLGIRISVLNKLVTADREGYEEGIDQYRDILSRESQIRTAVDLAGRKLVPYLDYLD